MGTRPRTLPTLLLVAVFLTLTSCSGSDPQPRPPSASGDSLRAVEVSRTAGIADRTPTFGKNCVADLDADGELDLILSTHQAGGWLLYRGRPGGRFEIDPSFEFPERDRHGCAVADFDGDRLLDVYMSIGACRGECREPKELWMQQPDHSFVDEAAAWGVDDPAGRGRTPVVLDANADGRPDLFTGQDEPVDHPSANTLWINRGDRFEVAVGPVISTMGSFCSIAADLDADGFDELGLCTNEDGFFLYANDAGELVPRTEDLGVEPYGRRGALFPDVDGDGRPDLATVARDHVQVHLNRAGSFEAPTFTTEVTDGKDLAFGDVDADGDLDMYIVLGKETEDPDQVFLNTGDGEFRLGPELPHPTGGAGDTVTVVPDWKRDGRDAFIVNNGDGEEPGSLPRLMFEFVDR